jgi:heterodisulfide reductase subunit C
VFQSILFALVTIVAFYFALGNFKKVRRNILLGKAAPSNGALGAGGSGNPSERWRKVWLIAFGQQKMFKRWIPAVLHFFIYAAFVVTQIELVEIFVDGFTGSHRIFAEPLGWFYTFLISFIELLSLLAFVATIIFLLRRNVLKIKRFHNPEMKGFPFRDGNLILLGEILLIVGIFCMNGADTVLQKIGAPHYADINDFAVSSWLGPSLFGSLSQGGLIAVERFGWWLHILTVFAFINYLPISKHLHILLAFPNTWYASLLPKGKMTNMPEIQREVANMMNPEAVPASEETPEVLSFGANDVFTLHWKNILDAYTCTECGRCTSVCPANLTGKKLSPRKVMMDVRDRAEEIGKNLDSKSEKFNIPLAELHTPGRYDDGKSLFDYISREEIHACTTCNACVEACPVLINPLDIILQLRRYEILTESAGPGDWLPMFNSLENSQSAWAIAEARDAWRMEN